jgi:hypothetical protein
MIMNSKEGYAKYKLALKVEGEEKRKLIATFR